MTRLLSGDAVNMLLQERTEANVTVLMPNIIIHPTRSSS
jgi:hypothetical protein